MNPEVAAARRRQPTSAVTPTQTPSVSSSNPYSSGTRTPPPMMGGSDAAEDDDDGQRFSDAPDQVASARAAVSDLFSQWMDPLTEWNLPHVSREIMELIKQDEELLDQLIDESLMKTVYDIGLALITRQRAQHTWVSQARSTLNTPTVRSTGNGWAEAREGKVRLTKKFDWMHQPILVARRHYVRYEIATKAHLEAAMEMQATRLFTARRRHRFHKLMAQGMNDTETVLERYTPEDLMALYNEAERQILNETV